MFSLLVTKSMYFIITLAADRTTAELLCASLGSTLSIILSASGISAGVYVTI
jgi:hypothetical protein